MAQLPNPISSRADNDDDITHENLASMTITPSPNSPGDIISIVPLHPQHQQQPSSNRPTTIPKEKPPSFSPNNNNNDQNPDHHDQSSDSSSPPRRPKVQSKARAKKARKAQTQAQSSPSITAATTATGNAPTHSPLRPAKDILSRIRHDPSLDEHEYVVGYRDRHADVQEMPVTSWKGGDVTDEEFIPQHRILYFRKKEKGESEDEGVEDDEDEEAERKRNRGERGLKVWVRKERKDLLFGSGKGGGERLLNAEKEEVEGEDEEQSDDDESAGEADTVTKE